MAGRPIVIEFASSVRDFLKGTKDVERSLDGIADELKDAGRDAEAFERRFESSMKDAARSADKAARDIKTDLDKGLNGKGGVADIGAEAGDELMSNLGESIASGDLSSVALDTLGGLIGSLKGGAAGFAAVGIAIAGAVWNAFYQESQKLKELTNEYLDITDEVTQELDKLAALRLSLTELGGGDYGQGLADLKKYSQDIGVSFEELARVVNGETTPAVEETRRVLQQQFDTLSAQYQLTSDLSGEDMIRWNALKEILGTSDLTVESTQRAAEAARTWGILSGETAQRHREIKAAAEESLAPMADLLRDAGSYATALSIASENARTLASRLRDARDYSTGLNSRLPRTVVGQAAAV